MNFVLFLNSSFWNVLDLWCCLLLKTSSQCIKSLWRALFQSALQFSKKNETNLTQWVSNFSLLWIFHCSTNIDVMMSCAVILCCVGGLFIKTSQHHETKNAYYTWLRSAQSVPWIAIVHTVQNLCKSENNTKAQKWNPKCHNPWYYIQLTMGWKTNSYEEANETKRN